MSTKRRTLFVVFLVMSFGCGLSIFRIRAANPDAGTISPSSGQLTWDGTAAAGVSATGEGTCVEDPAGMPAHVNCDTFTLTVNGTPADWNGKHIEVTISWVVLASDYDLYIHKGSNAGPVVASSTAGAPGTTENG